MADQGTNINTGARKSARERKPTDKIREDQERQMQEMASRSKSAGEFTLVSTEASLRL